MAKLDNTSQTTIAIAFLVMNIVGGLLRLLWFFLCQFLLITTGKLAKIIKSYVVALQPKEQLNLSVGEQERDRTFFEFFGLIQQALINSLPGVSPIALRM